MQPKFLKEKLQCIIGCHKHCSKTYVHKDSYDNDAGDLLYESDDEAYKKYVEKEKQTK